MMISGAIVAVSVSDITAALATGSFTTQVLCDKRENERQINTDIKRIDLMLTRCDSFAQEDYVVDVSGLLKDWTDEK